MWQNGAQNADKDTAVCAVEFKKMNWRDKP